MVLNYILVGCARFNFNVQGDMKDRNADNEEQLKMTYPKFKNGEAVVRNVRVSHNYGNTAFIIFLK